MNSLKIMIFLFLISIFSTAQIPKTLENKNRNIRNLQELSDDIAIIHVNDVHCGLNETIGYDGFVLYRNELKKKYKYVITVDVGDHVQGGTLGSISLGMAMIDIMNKVEFDVAILGNHEFDYGVEQLNKFQERLVNKYVCANFYFRRNHTRILDPYKIITCGDKNVAFIGVVTPLTMSKTYLSTIKDENGDLLYDFLANNDEMYKEVQNVINELKNKADYIILLTHIGMTIEEYTSDGLLSKLEGVTAVLDGHTHKIYNVTSFDKNGNAIHIAQTGTKLQTVGTLILKSDNTIISETIDEIPEPSDTTNAIKIFRAKKDRWVDKEMKEFLDSMWAEYETELNLVVGKCDFDIFIRPENTTDSHYVYCRTQECALGDLAADAIKHMGNGETCIINSGSIRNNMRKGTLTKGAIIEILPFYENIVVKEITGQALLDALEFGVSKLPNPSGSFPQVSGITYDIDPSINSSVLTDESGIFLNVTGERRVSNVKINGKKLDLNKNYNITLREYMASGGDGYSMFAKYEVINESLITETDSLVQYIQTVLKGEIPEEYKEVQGRINKVNSTDIQKIRHYFHRNSSGLNAGGIVAIILSCVAVLGILAAALFLLRPKVSSQIDGSKISEINSISKIQQNN